MREILARLRTERSLRLGVLFLASMNGIVLDIGLYEMARVGAGYWVGSYRRWSSWFFCPLSSQAGFACWPHSSGPTAVHDLEHGASFWCHSRPEDQHRASEPQPSAHLPAGGSDIHVLSFGTSFYVLVFIVALILLLRFALRDWLRSIAKAFRKGRQGR
jgi:hypothetical protein